MAAVAEFPAVRRFWTVFPEWVGETAFLLGGGPSLRYLNMRRLYGRRVIAINNAYQLAPWADVLYFADAKWWEWHRDEVRRTFEGKYIVTIADVHESGVKVLRNTGPSGLEIDPGGLRHGSNSGYQAINLAYHFGARRIVLLGYDMRVDGDMTHWHSGHPDESNAASFQTVLKYSIKPNFPFLVDPLAREAAEVVNATPGSDLKCWPFRRLEDLL